MKLRALYLASAFSLVASMAQAQLTTLGVGPAGPTAGGGGYTGPGDVVSGAIFWGGFRAYNAAYATSLGNAAILCTAADALCTTIHVTSAGDLNTTDLTTSTCLSVTCTVKTLYDQSGNGRDITQATEANRPIFLANGISTGKHVIRYGIGAADALVGTVPTTTVPWSFVAVAAILTTPGGNSRILNAADPIGLLVNPSLDICLDAGNFTCTSNASTLNAFYAIIGRTDGSGSGGVVSQSGTVTSGLASGNTSVSTPSTLGNVSSSAAFDTPEVGIWGVNFSSGQTTSMNSNMQTYWGDLMQWSRRAALLGGAAIMAPKPASAILLGGAASATPPSTLTINEFAIGYFQGFQTWTNLTVSGTSVTNASGTGNFFTTYNKCPITINGVPCIISSVTGFNTMTLDRSPGNGTGLTGILSKPGTVVNRAAGSNSRTIVLTGTYTGNAPSSLDAQLTYAPACTVATPGATFKAWTQLTSFSASGGNWTGSVSVGLCDDWVVAQVRDHPTQTVLSDKQFNYWGVGVVIWGSGQSNFAKLIQSGTTSLTGSQDNRTRVFDHSGWHPVYVVENPGPPVWSGGTTCDNEIRIMNEIANAMNCVCGMILAPVAGTAIKQWLLFANGGYADNDPQNVWATAGSGNGGNVGASGDGLTSGTVAGINSPMIYGSDFEAVIWQQGEQDLGNSSYGTQLQALYDQLRSVNGRSSSQLKMGVVPVGTQVIGPTSYTPGSDAGYNIVRLAQLTWITSNTSSSIYGGTVLDASHSPIDPVDVGDAIHWCNSDRVSIAKRYTQALLQGLGAQAHGATGPQITSGTMGTGTNSLVLTITQDQGTALLDASGSPTGANLPGFIVTINGSPVTVTNAQITGPSQITVTTGTNRGAGQAVTVSYLYGCNPANVIWGQWANLSCSMGSTTITDASSQGAFNSQLIGQPLVITAGTNFVPGSYTILTTPTTNSCTVASSPCPSGSGTSGVASAGLNTTPDLIYDNFSYPGTLYPDIRGFPLQPTNGTISIP